MCVLCMLRHVCLSVLWDAETHLLQHRAGFLAMAATFSDIALWPPSLDLGPLDLRILCRYEKLRPTQGARLSACMQFAQRTLIQPLLAEALFSSSWILCSESWA